MFCEVLDTFMGSKYLGWHIGGYTVWIMDCFPDLFQCFNPVFIRFWRDIHKATMYPGWHIGVGVILVITQCPNLTFLGLFRIFARLRIHIRALCILDDTWADTYGGWVWFSGHYSVSHFCSLRFIQDFLRFRIHIRALCILGDTWVYTWGGKGREQRMK